MASLREKVNVEVENISILHNIYTGIENILKQILSSQGIQIPSSDSWHQDLLMQAADKGIITETIKKQLAKYLAFRHFFIHAYGFLLDEEELKLLVENVFGVYSSFMTEIDAFLTK